MAATLSLVGPDSPVSEGDKANFTLTLSEPAKTPESVIITTVSGTATYGSDYFAPPTMQIIFSPGQTRQTFSIATLRDAGVTKTEGLESFRVIATPANKGLGARSSTTWIKDYVAITPSLPVLSVTANTAVVLQGTPAVFTISLSTAAPAAVTVRYATSNGTAVAGVDYTATSGTIAFNKGELSKAISVATLPPTVASADKTFTLTLLSPSGAALGLASATVTLSNTFVAPSPVPGTYSPTQIRRAYGVDLVSGDGAGTTIAIVMWGNSPTIKADLAAFNKQFNLPDPPSLTILNQYGGLALPPDDAEAAGEITLDVEWAHAIAPRAKLLLVLANTNSWSDVLQAIKTAAVQPNVSVVSCSFGMNDARQTLGEYQIIDTWFANSAPAGVTFVLAAGDYGEVGFPASSAYVLAVAGTQLTCKADGTYVSEKVWNDGDMATGGGPSNFESQPPFQQAVNPGGNKRVAADVAFSARDFPIYQTFGKDQSTTPWAPVRGTSASAPCWAGLLAIANGRRIAAGKSALSNAQVAMYSLPAADFRDITQGNNAFAGDANHPSNNSGYSAKPGYDFVSGLGTPRANLVIRDLIAYNGPGTVTAAASLSAKSAFTSPSPISLSNCFSLVGAAPQATRLSAGGMGRAQSPVEASQLPVQLTATSQTAVFDAAEACRLGLRGRRPTVTSKQSQPFQTGWRGPSGRCWVPSEQGSAEATHDARSGEKLQGWN